MSVTQDLKRRLLSRDECLSLLFDDATCQLSFANLKIEIFLQTSL